MMWVSFPRDSKVHSNVARTPGPGNSRTARPHWTSVILHLIRPALLLSVTPFVPTANGPSSSIEATSASRAQLRTSVQKVHANSAGTGQSTECSKLQISCMPSPGPFLREEQGNTRARYHLYGVELLQLNYDDLDGIRRQRELETAAHV